MAKVWEEIDYAEITTVCTNKEETYTMTRWRNGTEMIHQARCMSCGYHRNIVAKPKKK